VWCPFELNVEIDIDVLKGAHGGLTMETNSVNIGLRRIGRILFSNQIQQILIPTMLFLNLSKKEILSLSNVYTEGSHRV
jgi:hypothetical protein